MTHFRNEVERVRQVTCTATESMSRRRLLASIAVLLVTVLGPRAYGRAYSGGVLPWEPSETQPPMPVRPGQWLYFTADEAAVVEAIVDRLIPLDDSGPGGKDAGCALFIDRQLAGSFGDSRRLYMSAPFTNGTPSQGPQSPVVPKDRYRTSLTALNDYCKVAFGGKSFATLGTSQQDEVLSGLEKDEIKLSDRSGKEFFETILQNAMEGFFADPIYGGNRDMAGWKLIGFPGARYDYHDWIERYNETYPLPPVSIMGRADWNTPG
jgi:gluconate 2-dehydrogenase gamma chain